jgi:hypothetical protein
MALAVSAEDKQNELKADSEVTITAFFKLMVRLFSSEVLCESALLWVLICFLN